MQYRVLLTSGESSFRLLASQFLRTKGCEVTSAINGLDALHKLEAETFDIILTDWKMPVMDGLTLLTQLLEKPNWGSYSVLIILEKETPSHTVFESTQIHTLQREFSMEKLHARIIKLLDVEHEDSISEPTPAEDALLTSEDDIYLEMMKDVLEENACLNQLIRYVHDMEKVTVLSEMALEYYNIVQNALDSKIRLWMVQDEQIIPIAEHPNEPPLEQSSPEYTHIIEAFSRNELHFELGSKYFFLLEGYLMEVIEYPKTDKHILALLSLFIQNLIPLIHAFRDRMYFRRLKEQFEFGEQLKNMVIENLAAVRETSNHAAANIGENLDELLALSDQLEGDSELLTEIEQRTIEAMQQMQFTDINNQKLFAIIGNIEEMFGMVEQSLAKRENFLNTTSRINLQTVAAQSILDKNWKTPQSDVDDLLKNLGL